MVSGRRRFGEGKGALTEEFVSNNDLYYTQPDDEDDGLFGLDDMDMGDGSDLHNPVREHVEAALIHTDEPYPPPLNALLRLGSPLEQKDIPERIAALGFSQDHVPDLIRMARDHDLFVAPSNSDKVWAGLHALEALKLLDISEVVEQLVPLYDLGLDWYDNLLPETISLAGPAAIEPVSAYYLDSSRWIYGRTMAAGTLQKIAEAHPEHRKQIIDTIAQPHEQAKQNEPDFNGFVISGLMELKAIAQEK